MPLLLQGRCRTWFCFFEGGGGGDLGLGRRVLVFRRIRGEGLVKV